MHTLIKKLKEFFISNSDSVTTYSFSCLFGMLGALIIFMITHVYEKQDVRIGTVNITGMVDHFIKQEAGKNVQPDVLKKEVKEYGMNLNKELQDFSREKHIVLLPSEAVIAGSRDYTSTINQRMQSYRADS